MNVQLSQFKLTLYVIYHVKMFFNYSKINTKSQYLIPISLEYKFDFLKLLKEKNAELSETVMNIYFIWIVSMK